MKANLVIFDWSGVVSDDRRTVFNAALKILKKYGRPLLTFEQWLSMTTSSGIEFLKSQGVEDDADVISRLFEENVRAEKNKGVRPVAYFDAKATIEKLKAKGKKLAVVSAHPQEHLIEEAKEYGLFHLFDIMIGSSKDKSKEMKIVLERLNEKPENAIYAGDCIRDVHSAKAAGIRIIAMTYGYHSKDVLEKENPDLLVSSLTELANVIE